MTDWPDVRQVEPQAGPPPLVTVHESIRAVTHITLQKFPRRAVAGRMVAPYPKGNSKGKWPNLLKAIWRMSGMG